MVRVVITGPESCGKTTLVKALAAHFGVGFVSEYAREYLEKMLTNTGLENIKTSPLYNEFDLGQMLIGQMQQEVNILDKMLKRNLLQLMICDTDALTFKIWHEEVFQTKDRQFIKNSEKHIITMRDDKNVTNVYLLCSPEGIEWQPDPLRENPNDRKRLFDIYQKNLVFYNQSYFILRGSKEKRLAEAIKIVNRLMK